MDPTDIAFRKMQFTLMCIALLCLSGIGAYFFMPQAENPGYIVRTAQVTTEMPGGSPERMEMLVTDKLEKVIQEIPEIEYIQSTTKTGISVINVNIWERYKNMRPIWDNLRRKVERAERTLPENTSKPIVNDEYGDTFGIAFGIIGDGFSYRELKDIADDMRDELLLFPDVAKVELYGVQDERVFVDYNNEKMAEIGLSTDQLQQILKKRNIIESGGVIYTEKEQIAIEPTGDYQSVEDIRNTLIQIPDSKQIITLKDIAHVYRSYIWPPSQKMHVKGEPALGIAISMRQGGNINKLGEELNQFLELFRSKLPVGIEFEMVAYEPERVKKKVDDFISNLGQAIVIVTLVMLFFLGWRTGLVVATLIPVVVLITFFLMTLIGIGLDQVSLAALMIALGLLVDNSIVVSESILVQMKEGKKPIQAAIDSCRELKVPLLTSSLTTCAAFLPIYLAKSQTGEYVGSLFTVVSTTLLTSWVIALTLIPVLCVYFLPKEAKKQGDESFDGSLYTAYRNLLLFCLKKRTLTLSIAAGALMLALFAFNFVPKLFFPPNDNPYFTAEIELPIGSSILRTEDVIEKMDRYIEKSMPGIQSWTTYIGNGGPRWRLQHDPEPPNPYYSYSLFRTESYDAIAKQIEQLEGYLFENFPDVKTKIRPLEEGTPVKDPVEIRLSGKGENSLFDLVDEVKLALGAIPGTKNIVDDWGLKTKKIVVNIDPDRAKRAGVTHEDIALSLESAITGVALTNYREDDKLIPVVMRSVAAKDADLLDAETFSVYAQATGESVPIEQVAEVSVEWEAGKIVRRNRFKTVTVSSQIEHGVTAAEVNQQIEKWLKENSPNWPPGYRYEFGGEKEKSAKANDAIYDQLPTAGMMIIALLMLQFNNFAKTGIILITIPLAFIGVVIGLLLTGSYFGFMTFLGLISLAGIVINNAIVLLDRIQIEVKENGLSQQDAIIASGQKRMRPILLTTVTTIAGLIPLWMGGGLMWEPMAIAIIFGLMIATLLTLCIVPVLYSLFFKVNYRGYSYDPSVMETRPVKKTS